MRGRDTASVLHIYGYRGIVITHLWNDIKRIARAVFNTRYTMTVKSKTFTRNIFCVYRISCFPAMYGEYGIFSDIIDGVRIFFATTVICLTIG